MSRERICHAKVWINRLKNAGSPRSVNHCPRKAARFCTTMGRLPCALPATMPPIHSIMQQFAYSYSKRTKTRFLMLYKPLAPRYDSPRSNDSSVVQSVERRTVNPYVTGSSPVRGAKFREARLRKLKRAFCLPTPVLISQVNNTRRVSTARGPPSLSRR